MGPRVNASAVDLREMRENDLVRVLEVEEMSYSIPWSEATFRGLLKRRDAELIVAVLEEKVIGHAIYWHVLDQGELGNVAVAPDVRGLGAGAKLVSEIITRAAGRGVRELFLEVRPSNMNARHLYAKFGFVQVGRRKNYYQQPVEDALVLRLET
jgi:ribosomal-protein-alanine N-acetyltransferase